MPGFLFGLLFACGSPPALHPRRPPKGPPKRTADENSWNWTQLMNWCNCNARGSGKRPFHSRDAILPGQVKPPQREWPNVAKHLLASPTIFSPMTEHSRESPSAAKNPLISLNQALLSKKTDWESELYQRNQKNFWISWFNFMHNERHIGR